MKFLFGLLIALTLAIVPIASDASAKENNVNNFRITSFATDYNLSKDDNSRSVLKTTELITAQFSEANQNHGLERVLPLRYQNHSVSLEINSVTDGNGNKLQYSTDASSDATVLRIGDPDVYVYGTQVYKITYTQRDVTHFYADTGREEWYWDVNGTDWKVPIDQLNITATISNQLLTNRDGTPACYQGVLGSTNKCALTTDETGLRYVANATNLSAGENITIVLGFQKGTFAPYEPTTFEKAVMIWAKILAVTSGVGFIAFVLLVREYKRRLNRVSEITTLVTEFIPPKGTSVTVSAEVTTPKGSVFAAQLIDFAVRHYIEIIETKPAKSIWFPAKYDIKIISDPTRLLEEEQEILSDMFGHLPKVGDRLSLSKLQKDTKYYSRTIDNDKKLVKLIEEKYSLRAKSDSVSKYFYKWGTVFLIIGLLTLSPVLLLFALVIGYQGRYIRPLTDKGLELRRYLLGLDKYIKAAEVERLTFLQGPDTAQKVGESVDVNNPGQLVKLYERVLPFAILFGYQKQWSKQLGEMYENQNSTPDWYSGNSAFNAVIFSSAVNSFSSAAATSGGYSSSGGSDGGGGSGGGGGGGGGGGW